MARALLILDAGYVMKICQKRGSGIDFKKLVDVLQRELRCEFYEKWYLNSVPDISAENSFYRMLRSPPPNGPQFRVQLFVLKKKTCKNCELVTCVQKGVDVAIATLALKHSFQNLADVVVLFTGDGDFFEALRIARDELRKTIILVGMNDRSVSTDITQLCSRVLWVDSIWDKITNGALIKKDKHTQRHPKHPPATSDSPVMIAAPPSATTVASTWKCPHCTFANPLSAARCEVCEHERAPKRAVLERPSESQSIALPSASISISAQPSSYPCPTCTFHRGAPVVCPICGTPHM